MMRRPSRALVVVSVLLVSEGVVLGADWPQFMGPNRDGKSSETGLLKSWPEGGPTLLWKASGLGEGFSSAAIVGDTIYTAGTSNGQHCVVTLTLDGKPKGKLPFSADQNVQYPGMRSTPTIDKGQLFVLSPEGDLLCAEAAGLKKIWQINILKTFKGKNPGWKMAESILVDGNRVYCTPGGPDATIVCLDRADGKTVWTSKGLSDNAAYASCMKLTVGRIPMIVNMTASGLVAVSANTGQFLWRYDRPSNPTANCPSPVFLGDRVFEATNYGVGGGAVDVKVNGANVTAQQAWETKDMVCHHGGYVIVDGYLYGNNGGGYACIDFKTGQTKWRGSGVGKGAVIYADGMLYLQGEKGRLGLAEAKPDALNMVGQFELPKGGQGMLWAHQSIANGRLYVRHGDFLYCYDIKAGDKPATN